MDKKIYHLDDLVGETTEAPKQSSVETVAPTETYKEETINTGVITPKESASMKTENGQVKSSNINDIKPIPKKLTPEQKFMEEEMSIIDKGIERVKNEQMIPLINNFKESCARVRMEKEMDGTLEEDSKYQITAGDEESDSAKKKTKEDDYDNIRDHSEVNFSVKPDELEENMKDLQTANIDEESDLADDDDEDTEESLDKEADKKKQEEEKEKYNERSRLIKEFIAKDSEEEGSDDISSYTFSNIPISVNKAVTFSNESNKKLSLSQSVPLFNTGRMIAFTPLTGSEIVSMSPDAYNTQLELLKKTLLIMYEHDASTIKEKTFTKWLRSIDAGDMNQLYFGLYKATFADSNYISYQCDECKSFFMTKKNIDEMYSINPDAEPAQKERLDKIINHESVDDDLKSRTELYKVSSKYAVVIKPKSLYNMLEPMYLDEEFGKKYAGVVQMAAYIGPIYYIDSAKKELRPIDIKTKVDSVSKTFKGKCIALARVINSISADDYARLNGKILNMNIRENDAENIYKYHIPKQTCQGEYEEGESAGQKCTNVIKEEEMTPLSMLFTRHQLATRSTLRVD